MSYLAEKTEASLLKTWQNKKKTAALSMTFAGAIQFSGSEQEALAKLKKVERLAAAAEDGAEQEHQLADEDFVDVTYRALSATLLADRPIDFSNQPMLKRATKLLDGQTVFKDHEVSVDNWVGRVQGTNWDTETQGIPPGINANLRLDTVKDPMAVRGVLQGAIHSASVTVTFDWKPSHPKLMDEGTFFQKLGEEDEDGEMIRIIVTKIEKFWEISLVWQGADQYAKQIGEDGKVVQQSAEITDVTNQESLETLAIRDKGTKEDGDGTTSEESMKLLEVLKKVLGTEVTEDNAEKVIADFAAKQRADMESVGNKKIEELTGQLNTATETVTKLTGELEAAKPMVELGTKFIAAERAEAIRLCKVAKGDAVSETILKTLEKSDLEVVQAWKGEFAKEAETKFPAKCSKCGCTEITRQSSKVEGEHKEEKTERQVVSAEQGSRLQDLHS